MAPQLAALLPLSLAAWQDWKSRTIYDRWSVLILALAVLSAALQGSWASLLLGLLGVGIPFLLFALITDGAGGGDVKLIAAISALVGIEGGYAILILSLLCLIIHLKRTRRTQGAFAPCVLFAYLAYLLFIL